MAKTLTATLPDETATDGLAGVLDAHLRPGDTVLLSGPVGAGKTALARAFLHRRMARAGAPEDVPSPTFTLVQTYDLPDGQVWHADLYRLGSVAEVHELGLEEAFATRICLVEWPDRLGPLTPATALHLTLTPGEGDNRLLSLEWTDARWDAVARAVQDAGLG